MTTDRVWVADTCALLAVRRCVVATDKKHNTARKGVFMKLGALVEADRLVYPPETYAELKVGHDKLKEADRPTDYAFHFVEKHKKRAQKKADLTIVKELMADTLVRRVVDPTAEGDEADLYVLSVAVAMQRERLLVGVLTQEKNDLPKKLSLSTACGSLGIVCLTMPALLHKLGIWELPTV